MLNWPTCIPDLSPIENIWHIIKQEICQRWPRTLQHLETHIRQEWDQIPIPKLQKLIASMHRRLQTVLKRRGDATPWWTCPCPNYFETEPVAGIKFEISSIWQVKIKSNHFYCHITTAQVPWWVKLLRAVLQTVQKTTISIWTVHIYRLYRRQCAKYTYIYSVHIVYYKDILSYQLHIIHRMYTSTLCTLSIHYVIYT